jgi:hypothetical protein
MGQFMKVSGGIIKQMEKEPFGILMEIFILVNFLTIKLMDLEFIFIKMEVDMKEIGCTMFSKVKEKRYGLMEQVMLEIIKME